MEHRTQNSPVIDLYGTSLGLSHFVPRILMPTQVVTRQREHRKLVGVVPKGGGAELRCPFLHVTKFEMQSSGNSAAGHLAVCADQGRHGVSPAISSAHQHP